MAITYVGSSSNPATGGSLAGATAVITPVAGAQAGDLIVLFLGVRSASGTPAIAAGGDAGQTWTTEAAGGSSRTMRVIWCRFNGTWSGDITINFINTTCNTVVMHCFRPSNSANTWAKEEVTAPISFGTPTGPPYNVTFAGRASTENSTVHIFGAYTLDDNVWPNAISGSGWAVTGTQQYINIAGNDTSYAFGHNILTAPGTPASAVREQTTNGPESGQYVYAIFYEIPSGGGPTTHEGEVTETLSITDEGIRNIIASGDVIESINMMDTESRIYTTSVILTELFNAIDNVTNTLQSSKSMNETLLLTDLLNAGLNLVSVIAENITTVDLYEQSVSQELIITEIISITDLLNSAASFNVAVNEEFLFNDQYSSGQVVSVSVSELLSFEDLVVAESFSGSFKKNFVSYTGKVLTKLKETIIPTYKLGSKSNTKYKI